MDWAVGRKERVRQMEKVAQEAYTLRICKMDSQWEVCFMTQGTQTGILQPRDGKGKGMGKRWVVGGEGSEEDICTL